MMFFAFAALLATSSLSSSAHAVSLPSNITLGAQVQDASEPLTTARIWELDPRELNPHRAHWIVERSVDLRGLVPVEGPNGFHLKVGTVHSLSRIHVRSPGYGYDQFSCEKEPDEWFYNADGARKAGHAAAAAWDAILEDRLARLELLAKKINTSGKNSALAAGRDMLAKWLRENEIEWQVHARLEARAQEWRYYLQQAHEKGWCTPDGKPSVPPDPSKGGSSNDKAQLRPKPQIPSVESRMETTPAKLKPELLARLPAQRWNGLYSVRVSLDAAGITVNGHFLIDSGAAVSIVSPEFLKRQGVNPVILETKGLPLQRVSWSGGAGLARWVSVENAKVGVQVLGISNFLLMETELFAPPETVGNCCDGILGADFLRRFAVEFVPAPAKTVLVWPRDGFSKSSDKFGSGPWPWVEVSTAAAGEVTGGCTLTEDGTPKEGAQKRLDGARWDTGSDAAVVVHSHWTSVLTEKNRKWTLRCGNLIIASAIPTAVLQSPSESEVRNAPDSPFHRKVPAITLGMDLIGRSGAVFDLANGKLWLAPDGITRPVLVNRTGLVMKFILNSADVRELRVGKILEEGAGPAMKKLGMKPGEIIESIDGIKPETLDTWEVEQRLSGAFGPSVKISWTSPTDPVGKPHTDEISTK